MKTIIATLFLVICISCSDSVDHWHQITLKEKNCSFLLPTETYFARRDTLPSKEYGTTYMEVINADLKTDNTDIAVYSFHHFAYPDYNLNDNKTAYLNTIAKRMQNNYKATIVNTRSINDKLGEGVQIALFIPKDSVYIDLRYYIINNQVYGFQVVSKQKEHSNFPINTFFNSLEIK